MKRHLINFSALFFGNFIFAQVGINTENPKATLEVKKSTNEKFIDGIIAPKLTKRELQNKDYGNNDYQYGIDQIGTIVFVTDENISLEEDEFEKSQITKIKNKGYYFFDGEFWTQFDQNKWDLLGNNVIPNTYHSDHVRHSNGVIKIAKGSIKSGNFLGTLNDEDLTFKRNNEYIGLLNSNNISFGLFSFKGKLNEKSDGTKGIYNNNIIAIGNDALKMNDGGNDNIAIGGSTLSKNTTAVNSIAIGYSALYNSTGNQNTSVGVNSSALLSTGTNNTSLGMAAFRNVLSGNFNVSIGANALAGLQSTSTHNKASNNVAIGNFALNNPFFNIDTENLGSEIQNNVSIGSYSGVNVRGNNNIFIGYKSTFNEFNNTALDPTKIENGVSYNERFTKLSNAMNIGNILFGININKDGENFKTSTGKIGIGAYNPEARLHIKAIQGSEILKLENIPDGTGVSLVIDENGFVKKSSNTSEKINLDIINDEQDNKIKFLEERISKLEALLNNLN